jgi:hypothetical protein
MKTRMILSIITLIAVFVLSGCSESDRAWRDAKKLNTVEAYLAYQQTYPLSTYKEEATEAIRLLKWKQVTEENNIQATEAYIIEYPGAPNIDEARRVIDKYNYNKDIAELKERIKEFLNGNSMDNTISFLNGIAFVEKNKSKNAEIFFVGSSNLRVKTNIRNKDTQKVLSCVHIPTPNQMVDRIESITPEEGVTIKFTNGHEYLFSESNWKKK